MLRRIIKSILCMLLLVMSTAFPIKANEQIVIENALNGYSLINESGERYILTDTGEKLSLFFDTLGNAVTVDEAFEILTNTIGIVDNQVNVNAQVRGPIVNLEPESAVYRSNTQITGSKRKVGFDVKVEEGQEGYAYVDYSVSITEGWSASINLTAKIKSIIRAEVEASFTGVYETSVNTSVSAGAMFKIPAGQTGAVYFSPYYHKHSISYIDENQQVNSVYYNSPKVNEDTGLADGLFSLSTW